MSPLSRNELSIVLGPQQIGLLRTERRLTLRGYKRHVHARKIVSCEPDGSSAKPWSPAIAALEAALPSVGGRGTEASIILANNFMQYVLVPWLDKLTDAEEMAFAQHCFREMYGSAADGFRVRISPAGAGTATLASAVDPELLDALGGLSKRMSLELKSIQPHLMVAYNSCRSSLEKRSAWLVLLEQDNVCLAALQKGQLTWIRKLRIGPDWSEELPVLLEREAYLAETEVSLDEVFLWAPHLEYVEAVRGWPWKVSHLKPGAGFV